jgi:alkyl sulfatase BDS1-like metallo-beta-lactamase superfamily hydrolase
MSLAQGNPATRPPDEFAQLVKRAPAADLAELVTGDRRGAVLDEIFRRMPGVFRADRAKGLEAVIHWVIADRPDGGADTYQLSIAHGACQSSGTADRTPDLTLSIGAVDFVKLVTGNAHAVMLVIKGRLRTKGDPALTAKFPGLFDVPKA